MVKIILIDLYGGIYGAGTEFGRAGTSKGAGGDEARANLGGAATTKAQSSTAASTKICPSQGKKHATSGAGAGASPAKNAGRDEPKRVTLFAGD